MGLDHVRFSLYPLWSLSEPEGSPTTCKLADFVAALGKSPSVQSASLVSGSGDVLQRLQIPSFDVQRRVLFHFRGFLSNLFHSQTSNA